MKTRAPTGLLALAVAVAASAASAGCGKGELPPELVGSYTRSGDLPPEIRAELSFAKGGMVLTVVRLSGALDLGLFANLFTNAPKAGPAAATAQAGGNLALTAEPLRSVESSRMFSKVSCEGSAADRTCTFTLAGDDAHKLAPCSGTLSRVQMSIVIVATGTCQALSGRWVPVDGGAIPTAATVAPVPMPGPTAVSSGTEPLPSAPTPLVPVSPPAPTPAPPNANTDGGTGLAFPPDIPTPKDHMSCLSACGIVETRCQRLSGPGRNAFLTCVEQEELCRARCEAVFPFFGK